MTGKTVQLVRSADGSPVDAELVTGLRPEDFVEIDQQWLPSRQRIHRNLREQGVPQSQWPQNGGWNWKRKAKLLPLLSVRGFGIRIEDEWQGAALINIDEYSSRSKSDVGKPIVYLDYLEVAPANWPKRISRREPEYLGCGSHLLRQVVFESVDEDYGGRIGLHSLDQSRTFYERHGMKLIEINAKKENLAYYEFTKEESDAFLAKGDSK